jgi:hypothetical protein
MMKHKEFHIAGAEKVLANLNAAVKKIEGKITMKGLIESAIIIRRNMEPMIPRDIGNLRASWFVVTAYSDVSAGGEFKGKDAGKQTSLYNEARSNAKAVAGKIKQPVVIMGFTANYAAVVHESENMHFQYATAESKFFEKALNRTQKEVLTTLQKSAKI